MESLDPVVVQDCHEEAREGRYQASDDRTAEEWVGISWKSRRGRRLWLRPRHGRRSKSQVPVLSWKTWRILGHEGGREVRDKKVKLGRNKEASEASN